MLFMNVNYVRAIRVSTCGSQKIPYGFPNLYASRDYAFLLYCATFVIRIDVRGVRCLSIFAIARLNPYAVAIMLSIPSF